jgi:hypothetical protein
MNKHCPTDLTKNNKKNDSDTNNILDQQVKFTDLDSTTVSERNPNSLVTRKIDAGLQKSKEKL